MTVGGAVHIAPYRPSCRGSSSSNTQLNPSQVTGKSLFSSSSNTQTNPFQVTGKSLFSRSSNTQYANKPIPSHRQVAFLQLQQYTNKPIPSHRQVALLQQQQYKYKPIPSHWHCRSSPTEIGNLMVFLRCNPSITMQKNLNSGLLFAEV